MMGQPIQQSAGKQLRAKDLGPFIKGQVRGYDDGAALVTLGYDLEEQFHARFTQWHKAEFVNDQQVLARQLLLQSLQSPLILSLNQIMDQGCRRCEAYLQSSLTSSQSQPQSDVGLPVPDGPRAMMFSLRST